MKSSLTLAACFLPAAAAVGYLLRLDARHETAESRIARVIERHLGEVGPEQSVEATVRIPNDTDRVLRIESIQKDCSCVSQTLSTDVIHPGDYAVLRVRYVAPATRGEFTHLLELKYAGHDASTTVVFDGTVGAWAQIDPEQVDFSEVEAGERVEREVVLDVREDWPASERTADLLLEHGEITSARSEENGRVIRYRLCVAPPETAEREEFRGELVVKWEGRAERVARIPCFGTVVSRWYADPHRAFFGVVPKGDVRRIDLRLNDRRDPMTAPEPSIELRHDLPPCFAVEFASASKHGRIVSIALDTSKESAMGLLNGEVRVLDSERRVLASVPVSALVE